MNNWISVRDGIPETDKFLRFCNRHNATKLHDGSLCTPVFTGFIDNDKKYFVCVKTGEKYNITDGVTDGVTDWMPLPDESEEYSFKLNRICNSNLNSGADNLVINNTNSKGD